jgi:hypothetical protein
MIRDNHKRFFVFYIRKKINTFIRIRKDFDWIDEASKMTNCISCVFVGNIDVWIQPNNNKISEDTNFCRSGWVFESSANMSTGNNPWFGNRTCLLWCWCGTELWVVFLHPSHVHLWLTALKIQNEWNLVLLLIYLFKLWYKLIFVVESCDCDSISLLIYPFTGLFSIWRQTKHKSVFCVSSYRLTGLETAHPTRCFYCFFITSYQILCLSLITEIYKTVYGGKTMQISIQIM